jgi:pimeloyl-ACP methyl ester carboxylesterase
LKSTRHTIGATLAIALAVTVFIGSGLVGVTAAPMESGKPLVVLLHGLGRSASSMWLMAKRLEEAGFQVHRIEYESLDTSPEDIVEAVTLDIDHCCAESPNTVHFVGHSLGGLVIRTYLAERRPRNLGRVVLVGTPNGGTALVDRFRDWKAFDLLGPTTASLGTDAQGLPASLLAPDYPVGVIAGVRGRDWNDHWLPGPDDGLVAVESTKLEGMTDFIVLETGHSMMRYSSEVADQVVSFLKEGRFNHATAEVQPSQ